MPFTVQGVAAGLRHRADDAAERAAVLRLDPGGLDLDFLQVFEHGVLTRLAVDEAGRDDPSTVKAFSAPLAPFTWKPPSISPEFTEGAVSARLWKLRAFGSRSNSSAVTLCATVVLFGIDLRRRAGHVHDFRDRAKL